MSKVLFAVVVWLASAFVLVLVPQAAHASIPPVSQLRAGSSGWGLSPWEPNSDAGANAACAVFVGGQSWMTTEYYSWNDGNPSCAIGNADQSAMHTYGYSYQSACPANSTGSDSCTCNSGYVEDGTHTSCITTLAGDCAALSGQSAGSQTWAGNTSDYYFCDSYNSAGNGHCVVHATRSIGWQEGYVSTGAWMSQGLGTYTGDYSDSCTGGGADVGTPAGTTPGGGADTGVLPTPGTAAPAPCPDGQAPGTVNGVTSCFPMGATTPTSAPSPDTGSKTTTNADGTSTTTATTGTTACQNGQCTTTTTTTVTTKDASGNTTGTSSTGSQSTQSKNAFCAANPTDPQCGAVTGGATGNANGCTSNPSAAGCGGAAAAIGSIWTGKGVTVAQVLQEASDTMSRSPIGSAVGGFFNVSGGGSCPSSAWTIPYLNKTVEVDTWCSSFAGTAFAVIRGVLLMVAGFMAFRIAIE